MSTHTCPVWLGYFLASPLRKLVHPPKKILGPHLRKGMTVLDVGCAMGFFSIPAAELVGDSGRVICVDCQVPMLSELSKRAEKSGVAERIKTRVCSTETLGLEDLDETVDTALAFAMVHESADPKKLLTEICRTLRPGGTFLFVEPKGHVSSSQIDESLRILSDLGVKVKDKLSRWGATGYVLTRAA